MTGEDRDPGLQPERTRLAWRRTTLACTVVAVLAARHTVHGGGTAAGVAGVVVSVLVWLGFLALAHRRLLGLGTARPRPLAPGAAAGLALCTLLLALVAGVVMI